MYSRPPGANPPRANFNLSTGAVASSEGILVDVGIEAFPDGWYRCWIVDTCNSTASTDFWSIWAISTDNLGGTYDGDGSSGIHIWGSQLEAGAFPSSYIPTTSPALARAADVLRYDNTGEVAWPAFEVAGKALTARERTVHGFGGALLESSRDAVHARPVK